MNEHQTPRSPLWRWMVYYAGLLLVALCVGGGIPLVLFPWIQQIKSPEHGVTTPYPMKVTIDVPDVLDLGSLKPEDLSDIVPNSYMLRFTKTSLYPETISANLIMHEIFLDGVRVSLDYGSYPKNAILPPGKSAGMGTPVSLEKLTPGEHILTFIVFQKYDPAVSGRPKPTVVTKYFTVVTAP